MFSLYPFKGLYITPYFGEGGDYPFLGSRVILFGLAAYGYHFTAVVGLCNIFMNVTRDVVHISFHIVMIDSNLGDCRFHPPPTLSLAL